MDTEKKGVELAAPKAPKKKKFSVGFRQNRRFELYVGREVFVFEPGRQSLILPAEVVSHPDFLQVSQMFVVKEAEA
jgi:hypothetical protein